MNKNATSKIISFYLIVSFYERLLKGGRITRKQYEKACTGLASELNCKSFVF